MDGEKTLSSRGVNANPVVPGTVALILADPMAGVRDAWRWLLAAHPLAKPGAEAETVAEALSAAGDVVLAGLRFADGTAADLIAREDRPVLVWTFLPSDERADVDLSGAAAVLEAGRLRAELGGALAHAAGASAAG